MYIKKVDWSNRTVGSNSQRNASVIRNRDRNGDARITGKSTEWDRSWLLYGWCIFRANYGGMQNARTKTVAASSYEDGDSELLIFGSYLSTYAYLCAWIIYSNCMFELRYVYICSNQHLPNTCFRILVLWTCHLIRGSWIKW